MAWTNGGPGSNIPAATKRAVRQRQGDRCNTIDPQVCTGRIDEYDHIINVASSGLDRAHANDANGIQGLCAPCHKVKTQREARAAGSARRARGRHPQEQHPGLV